MHSRAQKAVQLLILLGLASSAYLTHLDYRIHLDPEAATSSFCAISESFDCIAVAQSEFSLLFNVPVALLGAEFFLILFSLAFLSTSKERAESLQFLLSAAALPFCIYLAYASVVHIQSVCLVCCMVYLATTLIFLVIGFSHRWSAATLLAPGVQWVVSLLSSPGRPRRICILSLLLFLSQFLWVPRILGTNVPPIDSQTAVPTVEASHQGIEFGNQNAILRIEEFTDFQCPFCANAHYTLKKFIKKHPEAVYHRFRNYPLDSSCNPNIAKAFHPYACLAARYAMCAAEQNKFGTYQELLWKNQKTLSPSKMRSYAELAGLDKEQLKGCLGSLRPISKIQQDLARAKELGGLQGTPTFIINGKKVTGEVSLDIWEIMLKNASSQ